MRFYNQQHGFYCGVDLHARMLAVCVLDVDGRNVFEGKLAAGPEAPAGDRALPRDVLRKEGP